LEKVEPEIGEILQDFLPGSPVIWFDTEERQVGLVDQYVIAGEKISLLKFVPLIFALISLVLYNNKWIL
jgi:hypothetical protein